VCGRSLLEIADTLDSNENAVKALLHRARVALAGGRRGSHRGPPADADMVERLASAVRAGSIDAIAALLGAAGAPPPDAAVVIPRPSSPPPVA
jgi:hypothetical protein